MQPGYPTPYRRSTTLVDSAQLRPGRGWYAAAGVIAGLGVLAAVLTLVVGIRAWTEEFPALGERFGTGGSTTIDVLADRPVVLYVSPDTATYSGRCTAEVAGADVSITDAPTFTFLSGGRTWAARYEIRSDRDGRGRLTCAKVSGTGDPLLAVGEEPDNPRIVRVLVTSIALSAGIALLGLAVGGTLALVVGRRRSAHRRRLQRHPGPGGWPA